MDRARKYTDKELARMERAIAKIYKQAQHGIAKSWDAYMTEQKPKVEGLLQAYEAAKKSGDKELMRKTGKEYSQALREVTLKDKYYREMLATTTKQLAYTNEKALDLINGKMNKIYAVNYNQFASEAKVIEGYSFSLVNESAVRGLAKELNIAKDMRWNAKNINAQVLQGILQGESVDKIAGRLSNVIGMNENAAVRNARTMTTRAENSGRQDSYTQAAEDGVIMTREWIATGDDRTREWHASLNGVETEVDEPWENDYGEIMFPGDPDADPANVYNCRCAMRVHVKGFRWK